MGWWRGRRSRSRTPPPASLGRFDADAVSSSDDTSEEGDPDTDTSQSEETHDGSNLEIPQQRNAQLTLSHLASLRAASSSTTEADQHKHYAENGVKKSRIKAVLSSKAQSGCQCENKCLRWWV